MPADTSQIVNKAWNYAHVLRDDGLVQYKRPASHCVVA